MTRSHSFVQPFWRQLHMRRKPNRRKIGRPKTRLGLPDLDQSKAAVLGSLRSPESQRGYRHAIDEFIYGWLAVVVAVVAGYSIHGISWGIFRPRCPGDPNFEPLFDRVAFFSWYLSLVFALSS